MTIQELTVLVTYLAAISIAAERATEIIKNALDLTGKISNEKLRIAVIHCIAAVVAMGIILGGAEVPNIKLPFYVTGLLASAGSGVWNTMLSMLTTMKVNYKAPKAAEN
jgi:hypothetical protein